MTNDDKQWPGGQAKAVLDDFRAAFANPIEELDRHLTLSGKVSKALSERIEALEAENERLREALGLADAALRGANMNMNVVERKLRAALEAHHD